MPTETPNVSAVELVEWQLHLIDQLSTYTLEYIGVAVTIILTFGGIFYLFSIRPFEREQQRQSQEIKDSVKSLTEQIEKAKKELNDENTQSISQLDVEITARLETFKSEILEQAKNVTLLEIATLKNELNIVEKSRIEELTKLNLAQNNLSKDLGALKTSSEANKRDIQDLDFRVRATESHTYLMRKKIGSFTVPVRAVKDAMGTDFEYMVEHYLNYLIDACTKLVPEENEIKNIDEMLETLPEEYEDQKKQILELIKPHR